MPPLINNLAFILSFGFLFFNLTGLYFLKIGAILSNNDLNSPWQYGLYYSVGSVLQVLGFIIFGYLLKIIPLYLVQLLQPAVFALTILLSWLVFKEQISWQAWGGILLIFIGILLIIMK